MAREDFYWEATDEPHATRRKQILAKYPQVQQLFGHDPNTKYIVTLVAISQLAIAYNMQYASWPFLIVFAWTIGGAINHYLNLAIHEITHNLAFATPLYNRLYAIFVPNIPLVLPAVVTFQKYHMDHHLYQGIEGVDMDIPTRFEGNTFTTSLKKLVWVFCQPYFYILRPLVAKPKPFGMWEIFNWIVQLTFDVSLVYFFGPKPLIYLLASLFLGMGIHPCAGHFIAEHYVFTPGFETYSYYGPLNMITLNVGYHNEHHDFPRIPGSRLPQLRKIAPEFYEPLPKYTSWIKVIWNYIVDPSISPYSRVMRKNKKMQKAQ